MTTNRTSRRAKTPTSSCLGIALAGGGPVGAIYELGALRALEDALDGVDLTNLHVYVGVSAGGFAASALANGIGPKEFYRIFISNDSPEVPFKPEIFLRPALGEYAKRALSVPQLFASAVWHYVSRRGRDGLMESFERLGRALPAGLFDNGTIQGFLADGFALMGRSDDFRKLKHKLFIIATDLDTGEITPFGKPGLDHIPISTAVAASAALPGLFPPVEIGGRHFVDGALRRTLHASVALDNGADLVICVNPLIPFDARLASKAHRRKPHKLVDGGLPVVLSQTFRSIIHSRMLVGMSKYDREYGHADVILFEPKRDDEEMFFTNIFSYSSRARICEHAYQMTRRDLYARRNELRPILARHGIRLRLDILQDPHLHASSAPLPKPVPRERDRKAVAPELHDALDDLQHWLQTASR